jgi:isoleucyl-tRNA synthetase
VFAPLPAKPDHDVLERAIIERWQRDHTFDRLREQNAGGPRFSFIDGPVTANKSLGVHTAWGRTLKDVFLRYKALRGFHQRYQNGFDCQGLWIEVGVERELGLNSKREIEDYGLEEFARKCRSVVERSARELTEGSIRLGQWMDWGRDYYTFSDVNIEYIWRFLRLVHERGWLYRGHRATEWCPRCGTSISAHELAGSYVDKEDPSLTVRLPLLDRPGEALVVWTTTPWTLPANVAAAVNPEAHYGRQPDGGWVAVERGGDGPLDPVVRGAELVGWRYQGPFDTLAPGAGVEHRVVRWDEVSLEEGTGIVHIAPGCGQEDFALSKQHGLAVIDPIDEFGVFRDGFGWQTGRYAGADDPGGADLAREVAEDLELKGLLVERAHFRHSYPVCWRCGTQVVFRLVDEWFIAMDPLREELSEATRSVTWLPVGIGRRSASSTGCGTWPTG